MGKRNFLCHCPPDGRILDVGCGNNAPYATKQILPHCHYTGLDIGDYFQTKPNLADRYILTTPERFADEIARHPGEFDAVISSHNFEHCDDRAATLSAMMIALKPGGRLYMAFPSQKSLHLPNRLGSLNYHDDSTHTLAPPDADKICSTLRKAGFRVRRKAPYQPFAMRLLGLLREQASRRQNKVLMGTWALYGFETVIWANKPAG